jgi:hypothetical protein
MNLPRNRVATPKSTKNTVSLSALSGSPVIKLAGFTSLLYIVQQQCAEHGAVCIACTVEYSDSSVSIVSVVYIAIMPVQCMHACSKQHTVCHLLCIV